MVSEVACHYLTTDDAHVQGRCDQEYVGRFSCGARLAAEYEIASSERISEDSQEHIHWFRFLGRTICAEIFQELGTENETGAPSNTCRQILMLTVCPLW